MSKIVKVYWHDIATISGESIEWLDKEQLLKEAYKVYNLEFTTVGEIIHDTDEFIVVSATSDNSECPIYADSSMIMKSVIIRIEELK